MTANYEYIKTVGIALAALITAQWLPAEQHIEHPTKKSLRDCWFELEKLGSPHAPAFQIDEELKAQLPQKHQSYLHELVADEEISPEVAEQLQVAFEEALYRTARTHTPIMRDITPLPPTLSPKRNANNTSNATGKKHASKTPPEVNSAEQAQRIVDQDISLLRFSQEQTHALHDKLKDTVVTLLLMLLADNPNTDVAPEATQAAEFLVTLMIDK